MKKTVLVGGLESSGNHWMQSILEQHPELEVSIESYPRDMGLDRRYQYPKEQVDVFVLMARDSTCQRRSVIQHGYEKGTEGQFQNDENVAAVLAARVRAKKTVWCSYETLVRYRQPYLDWIFQQIGVDPIVPQTEYRDANLKYLKPA